MTHKFILAALLALLSSMPALAQDTSTEFDSRWNPYLGCWSVLKAQSGHTVPVAPGTMVCVRPSGRSGVAITTTVDGKSVLEQTIVADGSAQPLTQKDCSGSQTNHWSRDGQRLFTNVELTCAGRAKRVISGITLLANGQWIDSQATVVDRIADVRVRRYRRSSDPYTGPAGMTTAPLSIEDIIEASATVQSEALEAALDEANARFELNSRVLTQLADNGVSPNVIDLMVAQAYPDKFRIERPSSSAASSSYGTASGFGSSASITGSSMMYPDPMYYDPFYSSYYYYSPFAYSYYWGPSYVYRYGSPFYPNYSYYSYGVPAGGYYYGGGIGSGDNVAPPGSPDSRGGSGVVVNGRGYTRVRPAGSANTTTGESAAPTSRTSGSSRGVRSSGSSDSGGASSSSSSSSSSSGSSGASSGGGGGGNSGGGGRTAQPR